MFMKNKKGFTLVELTFSIAFIAVLSLVVMVLIANSLSEYHRGLTLNQINSAGMEVVDDMRTTIQNAPASSITALCSVLSDSFKGICEGNNGQNLVSVKYSQRRIKLGDKELYNVPMFGALCTGNYSYIWNSGYFESSDYSKRQVIAEGKELGPVALAIKGKTEKLAENFRLLKIYDAERTVCVNAMEAQDTSAAKNKYIDEYSQNRIGKQFEIDQSMVNADLDHEGGVELMSIGELNDLVLYDLYVAKPALSATRENLFYSVAFILGTRRGGINITRAGDSCKPPSDEYSELEYCAINKFNFAVEAGGQ